MQRRPPACPLAQALTKASATDLVDPESRISPTTIQSGYSRREARSRSAGQISWNGTFGSIACGRIRVVIPRCRGWCTCNSGVSSMVRMYSWCGITDRRYSKRVVFPVPVAAPIKVVVLRRMPISITSAACSVKLPNRR